MNSKENPRVDAPKQKQEIILARHLRDRDELLSYKFDNELHPGQEKTAQSVAETILQHCLKQHLENIIIFSSIRRRALGTARLVERNLSENPFDIKVDLKQESSLVELDQGEVNLPEGFKDGDTFQPVLDAWKIFFGESFDNNNLLYKFGDPMMNADNTAKYEKLRGCFSSYGECYAQFAVRVYDFLTNLGETLNSSIVKFEPVLVVHSATFSVIRDLSNICKEIEQSTDRRIPPGTLVTKLWDEYQKHKETRPDPDFGECELIDATSLIQPEILRQISIESDHLKKMMSQARVETA